MILRTENIDLFERNSFHIHSKAAVLLEFTHRDDIVEVASNLRNSDWMAIGGCNNIIFTHDIQKTLICPRNEQITILDDKAQYTDIYVGAGMEWDALVKWTVEHELWGLENLSLIPGTVGAAPVQNIGAYGAEVKDTILNVEMFDMESLKFVTLANEHCAFGYRESVFKHFLKGRVVITGVTFRLGKNPNPRLSYGDLHKQTLLRGPISLSSIRDAVCSIRRSKLPDPKIEGNVGSFFKNPIVDNDVLQELLSRYQDLPYYATESDGKFKLAAGWLIDRCGLKGFSNGLVGVHERQALVLVNKGGASGQDVMDFAEMVQRKVMDKFSVHIETEVNVI
ncbi:MAG: UDP-N-acetylmuramate dehydrogenase [Alistipes sp.]|nr:UDP-N-acetylmuramate dehydrogenase [Candidatus Alistipes equi]